MQQGSAKTEKLAKVSDRPNATSFRFFAVEKGPISKGLTRPQKHRNPSSESMGKDKMGHKMLHESPFSCVVIVWIPVFFALSGSAL
jgi:hypothetical protein